MTSRGASRLQDLPRRGSGINPCGAYIQYVYCNMRFEWDSAKAAQNLQTHGIAFEDAAHIFDGPVVEAADMRETYGEDRYVAVGVVQGVELAVVYTERKDAIRLISARRATTHEREAYWKDIRG